MTNVAAIQATPPPPAAAPQAPTSPVASASAPAAVAAASAQPIDNDTSISPRIVIDPLAGEIIEFLSTTGQVQSQIPSSTVVAYLRAGLTPDGLSKPQPQTTNA